MRSPCTPLVTALAVVGSAISAPALRAQDTHAHHAPTASAAVPLRSDLGSWSRPVGTRSTEAQQYFDQGLRWYYAFNHAEAVRSFREAQRLDPACVMCVWGEALALGPNMNAPMEAAAETQAIAAVQRGLGMIDRADARDSEVALLRALAARYLDGRAATRATRDSAYADAMRTLAEASPSDPDLLALSAEATMQLSPWAYWTTDGTPRDGTDRLLGWLERALRSTPTHPGACHFFIHAVEAAKPERAVPCAERLAALMPGAGHIVHMPAHIYIRVGRWADAITANEHAVHADDSYFDGPHTTDAAFYAVAYQPHNHHFLTLASVMAGASERAITASREVTRLITPEVARAVPMLEPMLAVPVQTLVTFGRWADVLNEPLPPSDLRVALAHTWYARGVAFAAIGRVMEARATVDSIRGVAASLPEGEPRITLQIAALAVRGELALRAGDASRAVSLFREAVALEDGLSYMEPPTWHYPMRHSLGKALLAAGQAREAAQVYEEDLRRFPENGWSLTGLALALDAQQRHDDATAVRRRLSTAWRLADVTITSSRY